MSIIFFSWEDSWRDFAKTAKESCHNQRWDWPKLLGLWRIVWGKLNALLFATADTTSSVGVDTAVGATSSVAVEDAKALAENLLIFAYEMKWLCEKNAPDGALSSLETDTPSADRQSDIAVVKIDQIRGDQPMSSQVLQLFWSLLCLRSIVHYPEVALRIGVKNPFRGSRFSHQLGTNPNDAVNFLLGYLVSKGLAVATGFGSEMVQDAMREWMLCAYTIVKPQIVQHPLAQFWPNRRAVSMPGEAHMQNPNDETVELDWYVSTNPQVWFFFANSSAASGDINQTRDYLDSLWDEIPHDASARTVLPARHDHIFQNLFLRSIVEKQLGTCRRVSLQKRPSRFSLHLKIQLRQILILPFSLLAQLVRSLRAMLRGPRINSFVLMGDTGTGKTILLSIAASWQAWISNCTQEQKTPANRPQLRKLGKLSKIIGKIKDDSQLSQERLQAIFNDIEQRGKVPAGSQGLVELTFDIEYMLLLFGKKVCLHAQDYYGAATLIGQNQEQPEQQATFLALQEQLLQKIPNCNFLLYLLSAPLFPGLTEIGTATGAREALRVLQNLGNLETLSLNFRNKKLIIVISQADLIPGFLENVRRKHNGHPHPYRLVHTDKDLLKANVDMFCEAVIAPYKNSHLRCYNLMLARSLEIILQQLRGFLSLIHQKIELEIFLVSALGEMEESVQETMTGRVVVKIPKQPLTPYGLFPLFEYMSSQALERF